MRPLRYWSLSDDELSDTVITLPVSYSQLSAWQWDGKHVGAHASTLFMLGCWLCLGSNHVSKILERSRM